MLRFSIMQQLHCVRRRARSVLLPGLSVVACAALSMTAGAQGNRDANDVSDFVDMELEELMELGIESVYGASKHQQRVTQAPSSISIITADEIERFGHRTLAEVLRSVRGVYVSNDRNYSFIGFRGFHQPNDYNTRVLVLIDGHRMNDNVYDNGTVGREGMVDADLIERVEIIRGPSSSIYGSSAFLGVINVITKRGESIGGMEIAAEAGTFGTYENRLTYGAKSESGLEWLISGSHYTSDGPSTLYYPEFDQRLSDDPRASHDGIARGLDGEEALQFFTSLQYQHWAMSAFLSDRTKDVPTASFGTLFNDGREWTSDKRGYVDLKYDRALSEELRLQARAFYDHYKYRGDYPYDYAELGDPPDPVLFKDGTVGEWVGTEWQLTAQLFGRHRLIIGGEYRENLREDQYAYDDLEPRYYYLQDDRSSHTLGVFAQADAALLDTLTLTAGVRLDRHSTRSADTVNPRVALIYNPSPRSAIKALYGEAFRAPNPYESYYSDEQRLRLPLESETVRTYELVYERYLGSHYRANVSGYYYDVDGLISQAATEDGDPYFDNLDDVRALGLELEFEGKFDSGALFRASYALQRAEDGLTGRELTSSPRQLGKLNVSVPVYKDRLFTSVELQYHGSVDTLDGTGADDFLVTNLTLFSQRIVKGLELSATIYNALDAKHGYPGAEDHLQSVLEQNGRTVHATFTYRF